MRARVYYPIKDEAFQGYSITGRFRAKDWAPLAMGGSEIIRNLLEASGRIKKQSARIMF
jgi:hypothetical protein